MGACKSKEREQEHCKSKDKRPPLTSGTSSITGAGASNAHSNISSHTLNSMKHECEGKRKPEIEMAIGHSIRHF